MFSHTLTHPQMRIDGESSTEVCGCVRGGIGLPAPSVNPHFPRLLRFNSHLSIEKPRAQRQTRSLPHTHTPLNYIQWHKMATHTSHLSVNTEVCWGWGGGRHPAESSGMCSVSWQSEPSVCFLRTKAKSGARKQSRGGGVRAKSIVEPGAVFSASRRRDAFNHIKSSSNDVSPAATSPHAPRPQPHGSGTPRAAKCPLWEPRRPSVRPLTTAARVLALSVLA